MKLTKIFGIVLSLHVGVILLVMFQPGCQTGSKKDPVETTEKKADVVDEVGSFNQGLSQPSAPVEVNKPSTTLSEPTRPVTGELFVPGVNQGFDPAPLPSIISDDTGTSDSFDLRPTGVSVYKIVKGDTLWGIARKNNVTLQSILTSNPNLSKNSRLKIGQEIMISEGSGTSNPPVVSTPVQTPVGSSTYTVRGGDNLSRIAKNNSVSLNDLMNANAMDKNSIIRPGQVLVLPGGSTISQPPSTSTSIVPPGTTIHKVQKGENLTRIASIYGTTVKQIMEWNSLTDAGKIRVGQALVVSGAGDFDRVSLPQVDALVIPVENEESRVEDFFKGVVEEKPIIDVPEQQ
ncbi:MAG: LysM peptidoglycan-binding domain-containing protein [Opitutales bacterium]|nr:LysM peptidoglycan-binding domain-containing protein [Opitutales bacterium]MDG1325025.1 LysM peptidoglycan-binding domain-containing protein [Opitutales bacterium]